jgi:uncharacterized membrane protein
MAESKKSTFGLEKNIAAAGTYLLIWVSGIAFFLAEKEDSDIRFHASQSIIFFGALTVLSMIPVVGWALSPFLFLVGLIGWIVLLVKTYQGEKPRLPIVADWAEKLAKKKI